MILSLVAQNSMQMVVFVVTLFRTVSYYPTGTIMVKLLTLFATSSTRKLSFPFKKIAIFNQGLFIRPQPVKHQCHPQMRINYLHQFFVFNRRLSQVANRPSNRPTTIDTIQCSTLKTLNFFSIEVNEDCLEPFKPKLQLKTSSSTPKMMSMIDCGNTIWMHIVQVQPVINVPLIMLEVHLKSLRNHFLITFKFFQQD